jgi:putative membrane protein (TIGR04086 family)
VQHVGSITNIFIGVGTLAGGLLAGRKVKEDAFQNGLMVGLIAALVDLVLSILGGFSLWGIVIFILALGRGWLGGKLSSKQTKVSPI